MKEQDEIKASEQVSDLSSKAMGVLDMLEQKVNGNETLSNIIGKLKSLLAARQ